jgi:hypothetical protein
MTLGAWLRERSSAAPPRLTARVNEALSARRDAPRANATAECIAAAETLLRDLLARESTGRDSALDLLTVDALVTYAFEAAAEDCDDLGRHAVDAAHRFAAAAHE